MHLLVPGIIAYFFFNEQWKRVWIIFILTMVIDLDHLLASPIFDPTRCSVNFHPLHSYPAIALYFLALIPLKTRIIAMGLLFHILTDIIDCWWIK